MLSIKTTVALILLLGLTTSLSMKDHEQSLAEFCWKDSYERGVGTIPSECRHHREKIGLLCYSRCPVGYSRFGFDCHQNCLPGWSNQGLFCRLAEYGRGAGYPWKFGDGFNDNGMFGRCQRDHRQGCEKYGLIVYPKCRSGFKPIECCICRPATPNCGSLGFNNGIDLSCAKKITIGDPKSMECGSGLDYDAGLCYKGCNSGYNGIGPVCWANGPSGWVNCGMGAAKTTKICADTIFDQVSSVGNLALNVATFGAGKAAGIAKNSAEAKKLKELYENMKKIVDANENVQKIVNQGQGKFPAVEAGKSTAELLKANPDNITPEDMVRVAAQIAALIDPTGVSDVVAGYTYPKCSKIKV
jgi:hypothetical protein